MSIIAVPEDNNDNDNALLNVQMHMDSLAPNLVIVVTCKQGGVDAMLNRNIEAYLCLLLLQLERTFNVNDLLDNNKDIACGVLI